MKISYLISNLRCCMDKQEIWKPIKGYEGLYEVSSLGRVRSLYRITSDGKRIKGRIISSSKQRYSNVQLYSCNCAKNFSVHRLVAETFIPNPNNLPQINHIDGNKQNNSCDNLEWCTASDNMNLSISQGLRQKTYRRKVKCIETQEIFSSISAAGRSVNTDATRITESIQAKSCCKGYTFIYADAQIDEEKYLTEAKSKYKAFHIKPVMPSSKRLVCKETGQYFDSIADAARCLNCDTATISANVKSKRRIKGLLLEFL